MSQEIRKKIPLNLADSDITYFPGFLQFTKATQYFTFLRNTVPWQQDEIKVYSKVYQQPRLTAFFSSNSKPYTYSNITMHPHQFGKELLEIKHKVETVANIKFNSCLLNLYRDGRDSNGWHSDDENELGQNPTIASISLGQERLFHLRHKKDKSLKHKIFLEHGSLLLMKGETQHYWHHQLPKTVKPIEERINLTFRVMK